MSSGKEPTGLGPEAREALHQLRDGIARARLIMSEAQQAIGRPSPDGMLLADEPAAPDAPAAPAVGARKADEPESPPA